MQQFVLEALMLLLELLRLIVAGSGSGTFNSMNTLNPTYTPSAQDIIDGHVHLRLTAYRNPSSGNTCSDASMDMTLTITPAPTVSAGGDAAICSTTTTYSLS